MSFVAKVIEDSIAHNGARLITLQLRYPRFVHSELLTHRMFSRNSSSSRAIPVAKMIEQVRTNPAMPVHWGANQPGMQARAELTGGELGVAKETWIAAANRAADAAEKMMHLGLHKQVANRVLEPFQWMHTIVSATEWDNWNQLRDHKDADPNIDRLAKLMKTSMTGSNPRLLSKNPLLAHGWHLPYVIGDERREHWDNPVHLARLSTARCARVSYLTNEGKAPESAKDLDLFDRLVGGVPLHASPTEHPAYALNEAVPCKNFIGFRQFRADVEATFLSPQP
jgi:thymidylate synthase ThyX